MAAPAFGPGDAKLFATKRTVNPVTLDPKLQSQITDLLLKHGIVQGQTFYTASKAETDAYNDKRASEAKSAGKEAPKVRSIVGVAIAHARHDATPLTPYVENAVDNAFTGKSFSLRFVNQGTEDAPKVLWAFVIVNARAAKDAPAATE